MRLPWSRPEAGPVDPKRPHAFREIEDAGLATGLASMSARGNTGLNQVAMTDNYLRKSGCGVTGCGKDRHDPIHAAPESPPF